MTKTNNVVELIEDLRTHAFDDCGGKDVPTHIANMAADLIQSLSDRIAVLEGERKQLLERQRQYRSHLQIVPMLLGPKAWELWSGWVDKEWLPTMLYQHYSWGPKARPGDGEAVAQMLLNVRDDIASGKCKPLDFDDRSGASLKGDK